ncbi:MAG: DUF4385 family protein [Meiothermus sp.]|nr:DUF4385 family protein [Meiothermus sp.]
MSIRYAQLYRGINFRLQPHLYRVGRGEEGVLLVEPYKSELLPHWRFQTPEQALESAEKIYAMYGEYLGQGDFVGMDMARKFLQLGYSRSKRGVHHRSSRRLERPTPQERPDGPDHQKAAAATIFLGYYLRVREDPDYQRMKVSHQKQHRGVPR